MLAVALLALAFAHVGTLAFAHVATLASPNPLTVPPRHISAPPSTVATLSRQARAGRELFGLRCASCHGIDLAGSQYAPSLRGVGAANVDWWVSTGRMPASGDMQLEKQQQPSPFTRAGIDSLVAYVTSVAPGGPPIPPVGSSNDTALGRSSFVTNCQSCHGAFGQGATVGYGYQAASLLQKSITDTQIVEAVRIGPAPMPAFDKSQIDDHELAALVHYLSIVRTQSVAKVNYGGASLNYGGPVSEGFVAWALGMLSLYFIIRYIGTND